MGGLLKWEFCSVTENGGKAHWYSTFVGLKNMSERSGDENKMPNGRVTMNNELERIWKESVVA
jgi:hypothetical protein